MDETHKIQAQTSEIKNVLPDVVHSQQIPVLGAVNDETESDLDTGQITGGESKGSGDHDNEEISEIESISEHVPSKMEYSITESENIGHPLSQNLKVDSEEGKSHTSNVLNVPISESHHSQSHSSKEDHKQSTSWNLDINPASDVHLSEESPVNLAISSDTSKEQEPQEQKSMSEHCSEEESLKESQKSGEYLDSLNDNFTSRSDQTPEDITLDKLSISADKEEDCPSKGSTGSEEIIKLDIRGQAVPKFPLQSAKIIFGPPPEGSNILGANEQIPVFQNLLSPFLVGASEGVKIEEVFDDNEPPLIKEMTPEKSEHSTSSSDKMEQDLLVEEVSIDDERKEKKDETDAPTPPKSLAAEETTPFSTMTTDYKTICEEYHEKLEQLEDAITSRDQLIKELTISLQRSERQQDDLKKDNDHLTNELQDLQHRVAERSQSEHDTIKAQISDFMKYQIMTKDESTKFYSAVMSGTSSLRSSNGEKDMDREEITVNYSKSDLRSSGSSDEFQMGVENKLTILLNKFDSCIEENLRNKLRESLIQILCDEVNKMREENDAEIRELESQIKQDKQAYTIETRRLRELLASVKAGNADIDVLRQELSNKHEKEMENLRTYFVKKCSDMERSYSEEVWRSRACASPLGSAASDAGERGCELAAGDGRRRARSADLPSLAMETSTPLEQSLKQVSKRHDQLLEDMKAEHLAYVNDLQARHNEAIAALEEQITQLKAHIQTSENTEANVSVYQQDIDLELEKDPRVQRRIDEVRQETLQQLQEQLQVLLSDPDAELSSWPLELVALRDKIHGDRPPLDNQLSSVREESSPGDADKWRQRRNNSFDQNRQLEEVTKERDGLKRVATVLQRAVTQLVAYCASAEDELNRTVLAQLLHRLAALETIETDSRPSSPNLTELDASLVSRSKHVHFAPDLDAVLATLDEDGALGFLQQQRDLSADIKRELELSLKRLRDEAHDLLELSSRLTGAKGRQESKMLESSEVRITELVEDFEAKKRSCDNCEVHRKNMEEAMTECLQRESLLRADLEAAMIKIAQLLTSADRAQSDVIAEGYGLCAAGAGGAGGAPAAAWRSLDDTASPRAHAARLAHDLDALQRERDDLHQQLEAANRQLRATRQFVEEQAGEREAERDEFARRLADLRDENARLAARLQSNARILSEVEQLEAQTREMNQIITELESRKATTDDELKATEEKISLLRDIITNLEGQLEQKTARETEVLEQLEGMKRTIDERDSKMRTLLRELESLRSERAEQSDISCVKCDHGEDRYQELVEKVKEQARWLEEKIHRRTRKLERVHEVSSATCSEPSEDMSIRDVRNPNFESQSPEPGSPRVERLAQLAALWECVDAHARAEDAALRRLADLDMQREHLKDVAQEVRAERDVLQARMSEQALRISSLSARLQQQRNDAAALAHSAHSQLTVQLHDTQAEVQRLKEELETKDKQLLRLKQNLDEREPPCEKQQIYGNSCNPKDKVIILERELSNAQSKIAQLEALAKDLEMEKQQLEATVQDHEKALAFKEEQLNDLMALKLEEEQENKDEKVMEGKTSARTLSDIVSISEFDEQDLQMRRAELKAHNLSLTGVHEKDKTHNKTLPPDVQRPNLSSLNLEYIDHFDATNYTPRADSLPAHLTSTQNKEQQYKRNVNETTVFGASDRFGNTKLSQKILDNVSMYPNRDVSESKNLSAEPKKINFSLEATDNKTQEEYTSLKELGITLDIKQENFPDILTQLKHEIKKSRSELETCKSELKNAEEQLCEFPALKEEVEELKGLLENTMAAMENDKKFYENQLESFSSNKKLLEQRLAELTQEASEKSKDLHLLKEDILRRENMILELAKEKRNLTNKLTELEGRIEELQSKNAMLEKIESENRQLREKMSNMQKLEQLVSEKNQQIDSLNQHLDRFDDLQRCINDKTEELENLKEALEEKTNELFQLQDSFDAQTRDIAKLNEENIQLSTINKDLKLKLTKLEKDQENASLRLQNSESELERVNSLNSELTSKIDELKQLTDKLKDKETEIEILHEDINSYHSEIAALKEQLKMASRSPSPRNKGAEERRTPDRQASNDKKQLVKIKKQISLLQHELDFNKKELNDKAFELAKAKLDVTELTSSASQASKLTAEREASALQLQREAEVLRQEGEALRRDVDRLQTEKRQLTEQLQVVVARLREESNVSELKEKLRVKAERCQELEVELQEMRDYMKLRQSPARPPLTSEDARALAVRSPTAELERALRDQLHYSHTLDEDIMEQILSASSDEREDIPRLALNTSKSSSSIHSSSSDRMQRLRTENEKLQMQVNNLEQRLQDKDALITELNRIRDKVVQDWQTASLRYEVERDNSARLQLLLEAQKDAADSLQNQDSSMIEMLKRRLESAMKSELEVQEREQRLQRRLQQLERQLPPSEPSDQLKHEIENSERLKGELAILKSKLEMERSRHTELQAALQHARQHAQRELEARAQQCAALRAELAELRRLKHEAGVELVRAKELQRTQSATIMELENKLNSLSKQRPINEALTEIQGHKTELAREIATLRKCLETDSPETVALRSERSQLQQQVAALQQQLDQRPPAAVDDKDQAIRYLHGRCLRLESCKKALIWQKRYLQRVVTGYIELERSLRLPSSKLVEPSRGVKRFKCIAMVVVVVMRMGFLVRRRHHVRALSANCLLRQRDLNATYMTSTPSPQARETRELREGRSTVARRLLRHELRLNLPASPGVGDFIRRSPYSTNSPQEEPFILSSPRGDTAAAYLNKLEVVSRRLSHALDAPRDLP